MHIDATSSLTQRTLEVFNKGLFSSPAAHQCNVVAGEDNPLTFNKFIQCTFEADFSPGSEPKRLPILLLQSVI